MFQILWQRVSSRSNYKLLNPNIDAYKVGDKNLVHTSTEFWHQSYMQKILWSQGTLGWIGTDITFTTKMITLPFPSECWFCFKNDNHPSLSVIFPWPDVKSDCSSLRCLKSSSMWLQKCKAMTSKRLASSSCARVIPFDLIYEELMSVVGKTIKKC